MKAGVEVCTNILSSNLSGRILTQTCTYVHVLVSGSEAGR